MAVTPSKLQVKVRMARRYLDWVRSEIASNTKLIQTATADLESLNETLPRATEDLAELEAQLAAAGES